MTDLVLNRITAPIDTVVKVPASKSEMIRSLTAASLAAGRSHLYSASPSADVDAMSRVLSSLGAVIARGPDLWTVDGVNGRLVAPSDVLDCGESGLSARISLALAGSIDGVSVVNGSGRLPQRPFSGLIDALDQLGVEIDGDTMPFTVTGRGPLWGGDVDVDVSDTTQFATALMMVGPLMHNELNLELERLGGSFGYLKMTADVLSRFGATSSPTTTGYVVTNEGYQPADVVIEPDVSAVVYPVAIAALTRGRVVIPGLQLNTSQPDMKILRVLETVGGVVDSGAEGLVFDASELELVGFDLDLSDAPDGSLVLAVLALVSGDASRLRGLGSLRHKESNRLEVFATMANSLGADVRVDEDSIEVEPSPLHDGVIDPHGDHRIAMAFSVLSAAGVGLTILDPATVDKTWPGYWKSLDNLRDK